MPFPEQEQTFLIPGPVGDLEILATPAPDLSLQRVAIICHPHPLYGGSMHNKVLTMF
jgi:alpha/beta superfamily hydrolase